MVASNCHNEIKWMFWWFALVILKEVIEVKLTMKRCCSKVSCLHYSCISLGLKYIAMQCTVYRRHCERILVSLIGCLCTNAGLSWNNHRLLQQEKYEQCCQTWQLGVSVNMLWHYCGRWKHENSWANYFPLHILFLKLSIRLWYLVQSWIWLEVIDRGKLMQWSKWKVCWIEIHCPE